MEIAQDLAQDLNPAPVEPAEQAVRVLAADGFPTFAQGLRALCAARRTDIEIVEVVHDLPTLLARLPQVAPDVVLVDMKLPEGGGLGAAAALRERGIPALLVLVAPEEMVTAPRALSAGARGVLCRTCSPEELFSAIRSVAAGDVVLGPTAAQALLSGEQKPESKLSDWDLKLLQELLTGAIAPEVARALHVSESTLKRKVADLERKLGVENRMQLIARAARIGLIDA